MTIFVLLMLLPLKAAGVLFSVISVLIIAATEATRIALPLKDRPVPDAVAAKGEARRDGCDRPEPVQRDGTAVEEDESESAAESDSESVTARLNRAVAVSPWDAAKGILNKHNICIVFVIGIFTQTLYYGLVTFLLTGCGGVGFNEANLLVGLQSIVGMIASPAWLIVSRTLGVRTTVVLLWLLNAIGAAMAILLSSDAPWKSYAFLFVNGLCLTPALNFAYSLRSAHVFALRKQELSPHVLKLPYQPALSTLLCFRVLYGTITSSTTSLGVFSLIDQSGYPIKMVTDGTLPADGQIFWKNTFAWSVGGPLLLMAVLFAICFPHRSASELRSQRTAAADAVPGPCGGCASPDSNV